VSLQPGETKEVKVKFYVEQFGYYAPSPTTQHPTPTTQHPTPSLGHWNIAPGEYIIKIGASSQDIRLEKRVTLKGNPVEKPLREFYFSVIN
jgi:beta-glucosidase